MKIDPVNRPLAGVVLDEVNALQQPLLTDNLRQRERLRDVVLHGRFVEESEEPHDIVLPDELPQQT